MSALQVTWFILWALLWAVYFILGGFSLGLGALMPFLARDEAERRAFYSTPGQGGNEVWLIFAAVVMLAGFPKAFAALFSALYAPFMLLLLALVFRVAASEFRSRSNSPRWRAFWDVCKFAGSFAPAFLLGLIFANLFQGLPINAGGILRGGVLTLLGPYALCGGALFVVLFAHHGLLWLARRGAGPLRYRAALWSGTVWLFLLGLVLLFFAASGTFTQLYANLYANPALAILPLTGLVSLVTTRFAPAGSLTAWVASCLFIVCLTLFGLSGIYPALVPSSLDPAFSLTVGNSAAGPLTLKVLLVVAGIFLPPVIISQILVGRLPLREGDVQEPGNH